jgi:hypothetical protein
MGVTLQDKGCNALFEESALASHGSAVSRSSRFNFSLEKPPERERESKREPYRIRVLSGFQIASTVVHVRPSRRGFASLHPVSRSYFVVLILDQMITTRLMW